MRRRLKSRKLFLLKTRYFWISRSFKVINVGTPGKLVSSAGYFTAINLSSVGTVADRHRLAASLCLSATVPTLDKLIAVK